MLLFPEVARECYDAPLWVLLLVMLKGWLWIVSGVLLLSVVLAGDRWQVLGVVGLLWLLWAGQNRWQELVPNQGMVPPAGKETIEKALGEVKEIIAELTDPSQKQVLSLSLSAIADSLQTPQREWQLWVCRGWVKRR